MNRVIPYVHYRDDSLHQRVILQTLNLVTGRNTGRYEARRIADAQVLQAIARPSTNCAVQDALPRTADTAMPVPPPRRAGYASPALVLTRGHENKCTSRKDIPRSAVSQTISLRGLRSGLSGPNPLVLAYNLLPICKP